MKFSHVKPEDTEWKSDGLRDFFLYKDLGIKDATDGKVIAHLVKANKPPTEGTGWHRHVLDFQIVIMNKGWAKFIYGDKVTLVEAGDTVMQVPGLVHYLFDYSPDMEYLEICSPANFGSVEVAAPTGVKVPEHHNWTLDHNKSNLPDATEAINKMQNMNLEEVIKKTQNGELGSTEVEENQI